MYSAAVTEVIDIHEAAICKKAHLGINCPWKMADVAKERELARHGALWHSWILVEAKWCPPRPLARYVP